MGCVEGKWENSIELSYKEKADFKGCAARLGNSQTLAKHGCKGSNFGNSSSTATTKLTAHSSQLINSLLNTTSKAPIQREWLFNTINTSISPSSFTNQPCPTPSCSTKPFGSPPSTAPNTTACHGSSPPGTTSPSTSTSTTSYSRVSRTTHFSSCWPRRSASTGGKTTRLVGGGRRRMERGVWRMGLIMFVLGRCIGLKKTGRICKWLYIHIGDWGM